MDTLSANHRQVPKTRIDRVGNDFGWPKTEIQCCDKTLLRSSAEISEIGIAMGQRVTQSISFSMSLWPCYCGSQPRRSVRICETGTTTHWVEKKSGDELCLYKHFLVHNSTSEFTLDQTRSVETGMTEAWTPGLEVEWKWWKTVSRQLVRTRGRGVTADQSHKTVTEKQGDGGFWRSSDGQNHVRNDHLGKTPPLARGQKKNTVIYIWIKSTTKKPDLMIIRNFGP